MKNYLAVLTLSFLVVSCLSESSSKTSKANNTTPTEVSGTGADPLASYAWHLGNTGQASFASSPGISGEDSKIAQANALGFNGSGIRVAVSDTGTDTNHPDLAGNQYSAGHRSYASNTPSSWAGSNPYPIENEGHGTAVTGLIAALSENGIGSRGVAPLAQFSSFLFLGDFHTSSSSYEAKTLDQMTGDFDIFNYSYGQSGCTFSKTTDSVINAYKAGVTNLRGGKGAIYVKAAGNDYIGNNSECYTGVTSLYIGNSNTSEDQNVPYIIMAAALNAKGEISSYSTPGSGVWISSAAGEFGTTDPAIITTDIMGCANGLSTSSSSANAFNRGSSALNSNCNYTNIMNGTSAATPTLAGIIALILDANPDLTWREVKDILVKTAEKVKYVTSAILHPRGSSFGLSGYDYDYRYIDNNAGYSFSNTYGFGRANAFAAVKMASSYNTDLGEYKETFNPNNSNWYYESSTSNRVIPDNSSVGISDSLNVLHNYKIESVQIRVTIQHSYIGDLGVELISPKGSVSRLLLINSNIRDANLTDYLLISNAFYGEESKGSWTVRVVDGATNDTGFLQKWKIKINGAAVVSGSDTTAPNAPSSITSSGNTISFVASGSSDVLRYEAAIGTSSGGQQAAQWYSVGSGTTFTATGLTPGSTYFVNIRAIDTSENISSVVTRSWVAN